MHFLHISLGLRTRERTSPITMMDVGNEPTELSSSCAAFARARYGCSTIWTTRAKQNRSKICKCPALGARHQVKVVPVNQQVESNAQSARHGEAFSATPPTVRCQVVMLWTPVCLAPALRSPEPIFGPVGVRGRGASQWARRGAERSSETCCR